MSTINQYERWREREREVGRVVYWCGGGLGNEIQCGGGLGDVIQCGGRLVELQSWVLEDLAVELEQASGPITCCSVVVDLWGATVGLGLGAVELATCGGLIGGRLRLWSCDGYPWWSQHWLQRVQDQQGNFAGCGAVFGEASTGYNECSSHNGNLAGCGATGCWSQRALCGTSKKLGFGQALEPIWSPWRR